MATSFWLARESKLTVVGPSSNLLTLHSPFSLAFSVTLFCSEAVIVVIILMMRRSKSVGGELGGPVGLKYLTSSILVGLWLIYLVMSSLEAYGVIKGF